jgi:hypothetical protein
VYRRACGSTSAPGADTPTINLRVRAKTTSGLPVAFGIRPFAKIENWSLKICYWQFGKGFSMANDKFSIFNSQSPSKLRFLGAISIMFELRLFVGTYFCTGAKALPISPPV